MHYSKSADVAKTLGVSYSRLFNLLRARKITPPTKDSSGDFIWTESDIEAAKKAIQVGRGVKGSETIPIAGAVAPADLCGMKAAGK